MSNAVLKLLVTGKSKHWERTWDIDQSRYGGKYGLLHSQDVEKEYRILLNQDKKETGLTWKMKTLAEQW